MKILLPVLIIFIACNSYSSDEYVTAEDIEISFPGAALEVDRSWSPAKVLSIEYSVDPLGEHKREAKFGVQRWEFSLQENFNTKIIVHILVLSCPPGFRIMYMRVRARRGDEVGPWSESGEIFIHGFRPDSFITPLLSKIKVR